MYDYLAKVILIGPSGTGKYVSCRIHYSLCLLLTASSRRSCLLHRFVDDECTIIPWARLF